MKTNIILFLTIFGLSCLFSVKNSASIPLEDLSKTAVATIGIVESAMACDCDFTYAGVTINICDNEDDTDELRMIFENLVEGEVVIFSPGLYILGEPLSIVKNKVKIYGSSCIDAAGIERKTVFQFNNEIDWYGQSNYQGRISMINIIANYVEIHDLTLDQNYRGATLNGVQRVCGDPGVIGGINIGGLGVNTEAFKSVGVVINQCTIYDYYADAISAFNAGTDNITISNNHIVATLIVQGWPSTHCQWTIVANQRGQQAISVTGGVDIVIVGNTIMGSMDDAIATHANAINVTIKDNYLESAGRILIAGGHDVVIEYNEIIKTAKAPSSAIWITGEFSSCSHRKTDRSDNVVIKNNIIHAEEMDPKQYLIRLIGAGDNVVIDNNDLISSNQRNSGIEIKNNLDRCNCEWQIGTNYTISNNLISNCLWSIVVGAVCPPKHIDDLNVEIYANNLINNVNDVFFNYNPNAIECMTACETCTPCPRCVEKVGSICDEKFELKLDLVSSNCGAYHLKVIPSDENCLGAASEANIKWINDQREVVGYGQDVSLPSGTYFVVVKSLKDGDCFKCTTIDSFTIENELPPMSISAKLTDICIFEGEGKVEYEYDISGQSPGSICLEIEGGVPPFNITWDDGYPEVNSSGRIHERLVNEAKEYCVTVTDACGQESYDCYKIKKFFSEGLCIAYLCQTYSELSAIFRQAIDDYGIYGMDSKEIYRLSKSIILRRSQNSDATNASYELLEEESDQFLGWISFVSKSASSNKYAYDQDLVLEEFMLSPNPSNGVLTVSFNSKKDARQNLNIEDLNGEIVFVSYVSVMKGENHISLDVSSIHSGIYFLALGDQRAKLLVSK